MQKSSCKKTEDTLLFEVIYVVLLCSPSSKLAVLCNLMQHSQFILQINETTSGCCVMYVSFLGFLIEMEKILNSEIGNNFA